MSILFYKNILPRLNVNQEIKGIEDIGVEEKIGIFITTSLTKRGCLVNDRKC